MRITAVETFVLGDRSALVKISTDDGLCGWGEPVLEGWAATTVAAVERMSRLVIGEDPRAVTRLWQTLSRCGFYRGGPVLGSAVAGLDQALWDLKGRALGAPVHELLGGPVRDRVRMYTHANAPGRTGDPARAAALAAEGCTLLKVAPDGAWRFLESPAAVERLLGDLTELRAAVGPGVDLALDLHGRFSVPLAIRTLAALEPLGLAFVEEPLRPEHTHRIGDVVRASRVPIATGERLYSREEFLPALAGGIAIAQPDPAHAGGITEVFRIATMAESYDVALAPHCPLGPVALAACLQLDLAVPNFFAQEHTIDLRASGPDLGILIDPSPLAVVDGYIERLTGPGLGIEVDEDAVRAAVVTGPLGASPIWNHADGGFAEW